MPRCDDSGVTANQPNEAREAAHPSAQDEVADICRDLIRIDTSNPGDHSGPGERAAAEYVAGLLSEVGVEPTVLESHPKRTSVVARIPGQDRDRPALLVHGHLDVVPAHAPDWTHDPFSGEVADDCVQILGGYGYMKEYEIERAYRDVRLNRIGAGTDEVMLDVIGRSYGL